jgi:integrase/recombinase XerD
MNDLVIPNALATAETTALTERIAEAVSAWLTKSPSTETRTAYSRELHQFCSFVGIPEAAWEELIRIRPSHVAGWRDDLLARGLSNTAIGRKLSVLRSLYAYLQAFGYTGANPADTRYVAPPAMPRDGKTVAMTPEDTRRLLDASNSNTPEGVRDRALLAILAYTGCRVGELTRLRVSDYKTSGGHKVLEVRGKGGKERRIPLHPEAFERLDAWLAVSESGSLSRPLFRPTLTPRGQGFDGFKDEPLTRRGVQYLVARYVRRLRLDPNVTVHSLRVTALTTARERGADIVDLQVPTS